MKLEKILVPLDGSDLAAAALETAVDLSRDQPTAKLVLLRATETWTLSGTDPTEEQVRVVHGRSGLSRLVLGSVAESVLRSTRTPILIVRDDQAPIERQTGPVVSRREAAHV